MATITEIGGPESSEEDSVSLTSTLISDGEGKEYDVECILAEFETDGVMSYLTKWDGYPIEECTWQLKESFNPEENGHDVFKEWQERKMRISRGYEKALDIDAWEETREKIRQKTEDRRNHRHKKKARMNLGVNLSASDSEVQTSGRPEASTRVIEASGLLGPETVRDAKRDLTEVSMSSSDESSWTIKEQRVFLKALQDANGPLWNQIHAWYGDRGTISRDLQNKTVMDMQRQLQKLRQEFLDAGRDPPKYMRATRIKTDAKQPRESMSRKRSLASATSDEGDESSNGRTSTDSMMEEIKAAKKSQTAKEKVTHKEISHAMKSPRTPARESHPKIVKKESSILKQVSDIPSNNDHSRKPRDQITKPSPTRAIQSSKSKKSNLVSEKPYSEPTRQPPPQTETTKRSYTGTAQQPPKATGAPQSSDRTRIGVSTTGPARLSAPQSRLRVDRPTLKAKTSGLDVMANWGGESKVKKTKTLPTTNAAPGTDQPLKTFKTLGIRNNFQKWRQNEPAPDPANLIFIDRKTGKAPKTIAASATADTITDLSPKSPFGQHQAAFAEKESIDRQPEEKHEIRSHKEVSKDDSLFIDDAELSTDNTSGGDGGSDGDGDGDATADRSKLEIPGFTHSKADSHASPLQSTNMDSPANAPTGSRTDVIQPSQHLLQRPSSDLSQPAMTDTTSPAPPPAQVGSHADASTVTLRGNPTQLEKDELFHKIEKCLVMGNFVIGPKSNDIGRMKLAGFDWDVQRLLLTIKDPDNPFRVAFEFKNICSVIDYQTYWHNELTTYTGSGHVVPYPENQRSYDSVADLLACHLSLGIFLAPEFTMVTWPAHSSLWGFLERSLPEVPPGAVLRFAIREKISQHFKHQIQSPITTHLRLEDPVVYNEMKTNIGDRPIRPEERSVNVVFQEVFGIDFDRLLAPSGIQKRLPGKNFFLCFVPANCEQYEPDDAKRQALRRRASQEHDFFVRFLKENGADTICSMQDITSHEPVQNGSWRYFIENVKSGAIIIHESCGRPDQLPHLAKFLSSREGAINVWMTSLSPMDPPNGNHPHLVHLLPQGGVILLTISLILYHPYEALRILRWFRLHQLPSKQSGTWKIAVRPRINEWLLDIHDLCHQETWKSPFGDFNLQVYADIRTELWFLLQRNVEPWGLLVERWDPEVPLREAPVVAEISLQRGQKEWEGDSFETAKINHVAVRWNDEELIQWFSEWAGTHLQDYRRFQVILGYPKGDKEGDYLTRCYEKGYGYLDDGPNKPGRQERGLVRRPDGTEFRSIWERNLLEIISYEKCFSRHNIPDQATLDKKFADFHQKEKDRLPIVRAEANAARREERAAARNTLATVMQICRDRGGNETHARAAGRRHLLWLRDEQGSATDKEVEDCAIDMDWKQPNGYSWMTRIMNGTPEEREIAIKEQEKEKKRLKDKETLSATDERDRMWEEEVRMWAEKDLLLMAEEMEIDAGDGNGDEDGDEDGDAKKDGDDDDEDGE